MAQLEANNHKNHIQNTKNEIPMAKAPSTIPELIVKKGYYDQKNLRCLANQDFNIILNFIN